MTKGLMSLFSKTSAVTAATMFAACSTVPKVYVEDVSSNPNYQEANFYGEVIHTTKIGEKKPINQILIAGERGTLVSFNTSQDYQVHDKVLFKATGNDKAQVIKVDKNKYDYTVNEESYKYNHKPSQYYTDIGKTDNQKYIDVDKLKNVKTYQSIN